MAITDFFDDPRDQSLVKATIVGKYFQAWANVILSWKQPGQIAYIDLFAGPGRYQDGTISTPILVLEQAIQHPKLRERLVTLFNDKDEQNVLSLKTAIRELHGVETLKHPPEVKCLDVGEHIATQFERVRLIPTLLFVDPWGYKGLSLRLIESVLRNNGCDCIFFFNYNRIRAGINNSAVEEHMAALFEAERLQRLRTNLVGLSPQECEFSIIEEISQALQQPGQRYVLPFRFVDQHGTRTSHHLIFVSKHFRGYEIMKDIMANASTESHQGVASFEYNPASKRQSILFELARPLDDLAEMLCNEFAGQTLTMNQIYEQHSVGRPYIKANYKTVLRQLEEKGRIQTHPSQRRKNTFSDATQAIFPPKP